MLLGFGVVVVVALGVLATRNIGGSCSEDDLRLAERIDHYGTAEVEFFDDPEGSGCAARLEVSATAEDVLGHYDGSSRPEAGTSRSETSGRKVLPDKTSSSGI
jgi:hypothetical protein